MHLLDCTRTQVTLPGESAQLAKHCGTCTQSCPAWRKCTASQVLRCVHTEMPCPKCRSNSNFSNFVTLKLRAGPSRPGSSNRQSNRESRRHTRQLHPNRKEKEVHAPGCAAWNQFLWPTRQHIKHHACPAQLQPTCQNHSAHSLHKGHFFKIVR